MKILETRKVNTNNGWGFGGWSGTVTTYENGLTHEKGRNSHRHTGTSAHEQWLIKGISEEYPNFSVRVYDLSAKKIAAGEPITIYVYRQDGSYHATTKEAKKNPFGWGGEYQLIKTITLNQ